MRLSKKRSTTICHLRLMVGLPVAGPPPQADAATATINFSQTDQTLRGFGGASVWLGFTASLPGLSITSLVSQ